jgi:hypothetical protein
MRLPARPRPSLGILVACAVLLSISFVVAADDAPGPFVRIVSCLLVILAVLQLARFLGARLSVRLRLERWAGFQGYELMSLRAGWPGEPMPFSPRTVGGLDGLFRCSRVQIKDPQGLARTGWVHCDARAEWVIWDTGEAQETRWDDLPKTPLGLWDQEIDGRARRPVTPA